MSIFTIHNNVNVSLISLTIAPSTFLALIILGFAYLYILHVRNNPLPRAAAIEVKPAVNHGHDRGARRPLRRPSFIRRLSARLRTRKQRERPVTPLWLPLTSLWLPLRHRIRDGGLGLWRSIQPAGVASRGKRQSQLRLLE